MCEANVPVRHARFYLADGTIILKACLCSLSVEPYFSWAISLQLQCTLYKLHLHFLRTHSELFNTMFSLQPVRETEGSIDGDPVVIDDVEPDDFDKLLSLFYPM